MTRNLTVHRASLDYLLPFSSLLCGLDAAVTLSPTAAVSAFVMGFSSFLMVLTTDRDRALVSSRRWLSQFLRKEGRTALWLVILAGFLTFFLVGVATDPAHAYLFQNVQREVEGYFTNGSTNSAASTTTTQVISFVFNAARFLFVIYIIVGFIKIVNAFREDDDYKSIARQLAIIVLLVSGLDLVLRFITG